VPSALAPKIAYLAGLDNLSSTIWHTLITDPNELPPNAQGLTAHFGPPDIWTYANERPLLDAGMDGRGQCIAALEGSDVDQASLALFNTIFGLPSFVAGQNYDTVYPDGPIGVEPPANGRVSQPYGEALVDIEYSHGIAPGAEIVLYAGNHAGLGTQGLVDTLKAATSDNRCGAIAISWAQCGKPKSFFKMLDRSFARGAAQGQSIFVATGDVGVAAPTLFDRRTGGCQVPTKPGIEENAGSPNVTAVGATEILSAQYDQAGNDSGVGVPAEQVWFFDIAHVLKSASTGGVSAVFKKPKFQKGVKRPKFKKRGVPDICLGGGTPARPGYWECLDLGLYQTGVATHPVCSLGGGTSIVPPQWAGILAILQQKKGARYGNIDPALYAMAEANVANLAAVGIRDVTVGNNGYYPLPGYEAGPGYDLASGWGSVDINQFVTSFMSFVPPRKGRK
jgi:subtilase family serine protease